MWSNNRLSFAEFSYWWRKRIDFQTALTWTPSHRWYYWTLECFIEMDRDGDYASWEWANRLMNN